MWKPHGRRPVSIHSMCFLLIKVKITESRQETKNKTNSSDISIFVCFLKKTSFVTGYVGLYLLTELIQSKTEHIC